MVTYQEEIFGPVLGVVRVKTLQEAMDAIDAHEYGNALSSPATAKPPVISPTTSGRHGRRYCHCRCQWLTTRLAAGNARYLVICTVMARMRYGSCSARRLPSAGLRLACGKGQCLVSRASKRTPRFQKPTGAPWFLKCAAAPMAFDGLGKVGANQFGALPANLRSHAGLTRPVGVAATVLGMPFP